MKTFFVFTIFICFLSCTTNKKAVNQNSSSKKYTIVELKSGDNGGFTEKTNQVITNQKDFLKVWDQATKNFMIKETAPEVDFEKNLVLLVALGEKSSGGYTIKIESVTESSENTTAYIVKTSPGKNCATTQAITYPYQIVLIEKPNNSILFNATEKIIECKSK